MDQGAVFCVLGGGLVVSRPNWCGLFLVCGRHDGFGGDAELAGCLFALPGT